MIPIRASVEDGETSAVTLSITGYGKICFFLDKMYSHCGATVLHNVRVYKNERPKLKLKDVTKSFTDWLLAKHDGKSRNFRRSRIIATDNENGWIDQLTKDKRWQKSNGIKNIQTTRQVFVYWLDRNK